MKIKKVTTAVVEANFDWTFVKVETDSGLTGIGEAFCSPGLTKVIKEFGSLLIGKDPLQIEPLVRDMRYAGSPSGSSGLIFHAITGIETALWDIIGKHLDAPLWQLFGGSYREKVQIYADCHAGDALESLDPLLQPRKPAWDRSKSQWSPDIGTYSPEILDDYTPEAYAEKAKKMVAEGFTALKFDLDVPNPYSRDKYNSSLSNEEINYLASLMKGVRDAVGSGIDIAADCHWKFSPDASIRLANALAPYKLLWLEDPIQPENIDAMRYVTDRSPVPILSGENLYGRYGFREIIEKQAVSIVAPDFQKTGGLSEARRIAEMADSYYMPVAPHNISSPIGTMASVHLSAAIPNFLVLEWHASDVPFWNDIVNESHIIQNGFVKIPDKPGIGLTLNEDTIRKYAKPGETVFE
jgi:L-alanine-DL-glutamate epimerase-like enolase superfamily enzyme